MSVSDIRNSIDKEIIQCTARILELKKQRNALSSIYRLPIEVLALILEQFQLSEPHDFRSTEEHRSFHGEFHCFQRSYGWSQVSRVCKRLQEAAVSSPRLWARVEVPDDAERQQLACNRAGSLPLELHCHMTGDHWDISRIVKAVPQFISRAHAMLLGASSLDRFVRGIEVLRDSPAPFLTVLKLNVPETGRIIALEHDFDGIQARLVELDIMRVDIATETWSSAIWPQLLRFRLAQVKLESKLLVTMLQLMPQLTTLSLTELSERTRCALFGATIESEVALLLDGDNAIAMADTSQFLSHLERLYIKDAPEIICPVLRVFGRMLKPSQVVALRIVGYRDDPFQWNHSRERVGSSTALLDLVELLFQHSGSRWSHLWPNTGPNPGVLAVRGTLIWRLGSSYIKPRYLAKFWVEHRGVDSVVQIPYLNQHAEAYAQHGLKFSELRVVDPRNHEDESLFLQSHMGDLDELIKDHAPNTDTIVVSESTGMSDEMGDWLARALTARGDEMRMLTYADDGI